MTKAIIGGKEIKKEEAKNYTIHKESVKRVFASVMRRNSQ